MSLVLVDTNIWIHHFQVGNPQLKTLLKDDLVVMHPFVRGELACGKMKFREEILDLVLSLPEADILEDHEFHSFVDRHKLFGRGLGFVDCLLYTSDAAD